MEGGNEKRRRAACRWSVTQSFWDLLFPLLPAQHTCALLFLILTLWASLELSPSNRRAESLKIHSQQPNALSKIVAPEMLDEERRIENENMRNPKLTISQLHLYLNIKYLLSDYYRTDTEGLHKSEWKWSEPLPHGACIWIGETENKSKKCNLAAVISANKEKLKVPSEGTLEESDLDGGVGGWFLSKDNWPEI